MERERNADGELVLALGEHEYWHLRKLAQAMGWAPKTAKNMKPANLPPSFKIPGKPGRWFAYQDILRWFEALQERERQEPAQPALPGGHQPFRGRPPLPSTRRRVVPEDETLFQVPGSPGGRVKVAVQEKPVLSEEQRFYEVLLLFREEAADRATEEDLEAIQAMIDDFRFLGRIS